MTSQLSILLFLTISLSAQNDTINRTDQNGFRQDYWLIYFENTDKVQKEGRYKDGMREGVWKQYFENGTIGSEITYIHDKADGPAKVYHPNGKLAEEGYWKEDVWIGEYIAYYKNGAVNYKWNFSEDGTRTGLQDYFHENGKKMISWQWKDGLETGVVKRFNKQGTLIEEQTYDNGLVNEKLTVTYNIKPLIELNKDTVAEEILEEIPRKLKEFTATGERKLFDTKRRLWQEGYFEKGKLIKGKKYYYNTESQIVKTEIFRKGKVFKILDSKE